MKPVKVTSAHLLLTLLLGCTEFSPQGNVESGSLASVNLSAADQELFDASRSGDLAKVQAAIGAGANLNATDNDGETPLYRAIDRDRTNVAALLVAKGANVNSRNKDGSTPLFAVGCNGTQIAQLLFTHGAVVNIANKYGDTPLHRAETCPSITELLIVKGADVNATDNGGQTPLYYASSAGNLEVVKILLAHGAKVDLGILNTPLDTARRGRHDNVASLLIANGADPSAWPPIATDFLDRGLAAAKEKRWEDAAKFMMAAEAAFDFPGRSFSERAPISFNLGLVYSKAGGEIPAICWFDRYLLQNPNATNTGLVRSEMARLRTVDEAKIDKILDEALAYVDKLKYFGTAYLKEFVAVEYYLGHTDKVNEIRARKPVADPLQISEIQYPIDVLTNAKKPSEYYKPTLLDKHSPCGAVDVANPRKSTKENFDPSTLPNPNHGVLKDDQSIYPGSSEQALRTALASIDKPREREADPEREEVIEEFDREAARLYGSDTYAKESVAMDIIHGLVWLAVALIEDRDSLRALEERTPGISAY